MTLALVRVIVRQLAPLVSGRLADYLPTASKIRPWSRHPLARRSLASPSVGLAVGWASGLNLAQARLDTKTGFHWLRQDESTSTPLGVSCITGNASFAARAQNDRARNESTSTLETNTFGESG